MPASDGCRICGRKNVPLVVTVSGRLYRQFRDELRPAPSPLSVKQRSYGRCLVRSTCRTPR